MTPREVEAVRTRLRMTRAAFADLTRLGEASLARWEKGLLIQNPANDQLLYLLLFPENVERLRSRVTTADVTATGDSSS
jgi:DNA-binding transcriptional regulator YiaG